MEAKSITYVGWENLGDDSYFSPIALSISLLVLVTPISTVVLQTLTLH